MRYHLELDIDLKRNPYEGLYIAMEGIDGSGKTTQVEKMANYLKKKGKSVIKVREPRKEGLIGDIVQKVLVGKIKMSSIALQYLFSTDRVLHHEDVITPALKSGKTVISDRCFWSAIVYGILDRVEDKYNFENADFLLIAHSILSMYHRFVVPDKTFYLKIGIETAMKRISKKGDFKEIYEDRQKLKQLIGGYEWLAKKFSREITVIDGEGEVEGVTEDIVRKIQN